MCRPFVLVCLCACVLVRNSMSKNESKARIKAGVTFPAILFEFEWRSFFLYNFVSKKI